MTEISFPVFFAMWAIHKGWEVPELHIRICQWLETRGPLAVLKVFRGAAKSTIVACYEAYTLWKNPRWRFLVQAADDSLAIKMSRDTREVLQRHPLCAGLLGGKNAEHMFWVNGADDMRNASVTASGVMSNVTGSRADEGIFDDVEVPRNIASADLREKLRARCSEMTYILVPGGKTLYIGTPHCHDSIYGDLEKDGADVLALPLFANNQRFETAEKLTRFEMEIPRDGLVIFHGKEALNEGFDYVIRGNTVDLCQPLVGLIDCYSGNAWPERFTREEVIFRRKKARSLNEWDSQYMLRARPVNESRLNSELMTVYECEPQFTEANRALRCQLGNVSIASVRAYWDVASGKLQADASVLSVVWQDNQGRLYWHAAERLNGEIDEQCAEVRRIVERYRLPNVAVETNGIGQFVPALLRKALAGTGCSVTDTQAKGNKHERIIAAIEPALSAGLLWCHVRVADSYALTEMDEFNPLDRGYSPDYLDSLSGAILASPVRIKAKSQESQPVTQFRGAGGSIKAKTKFTFGK